MSIRIILNEYLYIVYMIGMDYILHHLNAIKDMQQKELQHDFFSSIKTYPAAS